MIQLLLLVPLFAIAHGVPIELQTEEPHIVGGRKATLGEIPYQVSLQIIETGSHFCGGSILNQRYVLTAAHCTIIINVQDVSVNVGLINVKSPHSVHLIESSYIHDEYNSKHLWHNDIALLKVKTPFVFSNLISPVTLPKQNQIIPASSQAIVSGFGTLWYSGPRTDYLHVAHITITNQTYCKQVYKNVDDTQICANDPIERKDSCQGDSGGPLTVDGEIVGIVSRGVNCGLPFWPTVYTRVPSYVNWINEHTE